MLHWNFAGMFRKMVLMNYLTLKLCKTCQCYFHFTAVAEKQTAANSYTVMNSHMFGLIHRLQVLVDVQFPVIHYGHINYHFLLLLFATVLTQALIEECARDDD